MTDRAQERDQMLGPYGRTEGARKRFAVARGLVGLVAAALIGLQSAGSGSGLPLTAALQLGAWLAASSALLITRTDALGGVAVRLAVVLAGDCIAAANLVRATGSLQSPALLVLALPVLAGGLILYWRPGLLLGLFVSLLYGLMAVESARRGAALGEMLSRVIFHALFFASMGAAAGFLARHMAASLQEAAKTRSELEAVRLSTDRIVENLSCGLLAVEPSGTVRALNPEGRRLLGLEEGVQEIPATVLERNPALRDGIEACLAAGPSGDLDDELRLSRTVGAEIPAWVKLTPVVDTQGRVRGLVGLIWDLTERKRLEELARHRERLAAIGELSAGLAHEIRNSLKPITGSIELLQSRGDFPAAAAPVLELVTREADSLEAFLSQFLALARDKTLKLEEIDLEELLRDEIQALKICHPWDGRTAQVTGASGLRLRGDREWLRQVFRNVLLNAFEASPDGKVEAFLEPFTEAGRPWIRVRVLDEGPGLQGLAEGDAFYPFRTTKPAGSGLGLPIAHRGIEEHGGRISFDRECPRGGCVVIEVPRDGRVAAGGARQAARGEVRVA